MFSPPVHQRLQEPNYHLWGRRQRRSLQISYNFITFFSCATIPFIMHIHVLVGLSEGYTSQERSPTTWRIKAAPEDILLLSLWYTKNPARPGPAHSPPSTNPVAEPWINDRTSEPHRKETCKKHKLQLQIPLKRNQPDHYTWRDREKSWANLK